MFLSEEETSPKLSTSSTEKRVALTTASQRQKPRKIFVPHEEGHEGTLRKIFSPHEEGHEGTLRKISGPHEEGHEGTLRHTVRR